MTEMAIELKRCQELGYFDDAEENTPDPTPMAFLFTLLPEEIESRIAIHALAVRQHNKNTKIVVSQINRFQPDFYTQWYFEKPFGNCDTYAECLVELNKEWAEICGYEDIEYIPFKNLGEAWESVHIPLRPYAPEWGFCYVECIYQTIKKFDKIKN